VSERLEDNNPNGCVYLVGGGPGDPGLLTVRALELIAAADVILYDRLIPEQALEGARQDAELLFVGKQGGGPSVPQEETVELMLAHARAGRTVVRLKGGDPFVFGRGGEEALALRAAGIPFAVVPGVTSGVAAAAYAGIPVTHRGRSIAVALVTGHEDPDKDETAIDWEALAAFPGTLLFYMGIGRLAQIAAALIECGRPASEAVAIVERGTLPDQRTTLATLGNVAEIAQRENVRAPAITVVGSVAELAAELSWLEDGPLQGLTVAVTRARAQSSELARRLADLGARVITAPVIKIRPLEHPPIDPSGYDLICLTSTNAVDALFDSRAGGGRDARSLAGARIAAIGPGTARALREYGIRADIVPERSLAEGLVAALEDIPVTRALIARARQGREVLPDALRARGIEVDVAALYETVAQPLAEHSLQAIAAADYITFTSSSTVRFFLESFRQAFPQHTRIVSIGPATSQTLRESGLEPDVEAQRHDIDGVVGALLTDATADGTASARQPPAQSER
jgi:uroporphyrinogen III methyltransferase/synthase